jgi:hypothetical protein
MGLSEFFNEWGQIMSEAVAAHRLPHLVPKDRERLAKAIAELAELAEQVATYIREAQIDESREEHFRQTLKEQTSVIQVIIEKAEAL